MHWLYFLLSLLCLGLAMKTSWPSWAVVLLVLASLGLAIAWMLGWMAARIAGVSRNDASIVSADELRRLREQASARRQAPPASPSPAPGNDD